MYNFVINRQRHVLGYKNHPPGPLTNLAKAYNLQKEAPRLTITQALLDRWTTFTSVSKK